MKIQIQFKDPDALDDGIMDSIWAQYPDTAVEDKHRLVDDARKSISPWLRWGEYVLIEFDTETNTATVIKPK